MSAPEGTGIGPVETVGAARRAELAQAVAATRERIAAACRAAGRSVDDVTLVAVTKFFPASDVAALVSLGVTDVGESRDQEAAAKVADLARLVGPGGEAAGDVPVRIHFVGQVQTNKAASVARYADVVQSLDRVRLVQALQAGAERTDRRLDVFVQVDLASAPGETGRGGAAPAEVLALADAVAATSRLDLRGLMTVAPLGVEPGRAFEALAELSDDVRRSHPTATCVSAGMSADLEAAVAAGATHLRVGRAILGSRPRHG